MNQIMHKLRSKTGASMILAMVFMLFCLFVGGSVLASAAENGYRVAHLADQQQFLDERSAAQLICDELKPEDTKELKLTIHEVSKTIQPVKVSDGGVVENDGSARTEKSIVIQLPSGFNPTAMQRVVVECTVWQYLRESGLKKADLETISITFNHFPATALNQFWYQYDLDSGNEIFGSIDIDGYTATSTIAAFTAYFDSGSGTELYDFYVDFGDFTQMNIKMDGFMGAKNPVTSSRITTADDGSYARITTVTRQIAISWDDPVIEKGGV